MAYLVLGSIWVNRRALCTQNTILFCKEVTYINLNHRGLRRKKTIFLKVGISEEMRGAHFIHKTQYVNQLIRWNIYKIVYYLCNPVSEQTYIQKQGSVTLDTIVTMFQNRDALQVHREGDYYISLVSFRTELHISLPGKLYCILSYMQMEEDRTCLPCFVIMVNPGKDSNRFGHIWI